MLLVHSVYFTLHDNSAAARKTLTDACNKYLTDHPGTVFYAVGTLAAEYNRPVNDHGYDVALNVIFKDRAAHDAYQVAPRHLEFIAENKPNWKLVRVFDSDAPIGA
ncbi:MAG: Dabb family protein [Planctomycetia bacterium]|nr:Dabb family protein [Planctomycetia bacterium]